MMIDFYNKPTLGKEHLGHYDGYEIERPEWVWNMYRELENAGFRFHIVVEDQVILIARLNGIAFYSEQHPNDQVLGKRIDNFFQKVKMNNASTTVVEESKDENSISESNELPQLQEPELDIATDGTLPDRRSESGNGQSEHGGEDNSTGLDSVDTVRLST